MPWDVRKHYTLNSKPQPLATPLILTTSKPFEIDKTVFTCETYLRDSSGWYIKGLEPSGDHWHHDAPDEAVAAEDDAGLGDFRV